MCKNPLHITKVCNLLHGCFHRLYSCPQFFTLYLCPSSYNSVLPILSPHSLNLNRLHDLFWPLVSSRSYDIAICGVWASRALLCFCCCIVLCHCHKPTSPRRRRTSGETGSVNPFASDQVSLNNPRTRQAT